MARAICTVDECNRTVHGGGLCHAHYDVGYRTENYESIKVRAAERRARNADRERVRHENYYAENRQLVLDRAAKSQTEHPDRHRLNVARYRARHPERVRAGRITAEAKRRAAKATTPREIRLTVAEWEAIKDAHHQACAYCGRPGVKLEKDHVIPLSLGGIDSKENVVPACQTCNARKGARILRYG